MATNDYDRDSIDPIMQSLKELRENLPNGMLSDRETMLEKARELVTALQTPSEAVSWIIYAEPARGVATRIAIDLKLFETLVAENGRPKTAEELAKPTGASPVLVNRIARCLAAMHMIEETSSSVYAPTPLTEALAQPKYSGGIQFSHDATTLPFLKMPEYLATTAYENPVNSSKGPWHYAHNQEPFAWLGERPELLQAFHAYIYGMQEDRPYWTDAGFYPIRERLISGLQSSKGGDSDSSAFVDVGGGTGHTLLMFEARNKDWMGRLVLQKTAPVVELARGIATISSTNTIELTVHDFFAEQPIKGARAYFLRSVLHDWNDDNCRRILRRLKDAMQPGYSKLLLNECVVSDSKADWRHAAVDIYMMGLNTAQERSASEWYKLIESVGLKIDGIWGN